MAKLAKIIILMKRTSYIAFSVFAVMTISSYLCKKITNTKSATAQHKLDINCLRENNENMNKIERPVGEVLNEVGLPKDYYERDLIEENNIVDRLSPILKTNIAIIEEAQRIQINMLKTLIGKFKYAMLFNFAAFENKGDSAITVGELHVIKKLGIELIFHCETNHCRGSTLDYAQEMSKQYRVEDLIILLHGGGNLLSYLNEDYNRKYVLERFENFQLILFPQSLWHAVGENETQLFQKVYSKHRSLTFIYRDRNSYELGKSLFPAVKSYLMPDMAFQIGAVNRFMDPAHDILWLRRSDKESTKYIIPSNKHGYDIIAQDWYNWQTPKGSTRLEDAILIAETGMMFLQRGRVVITDRLHGHILCVLCGIPHVVFDPVNHKISSYMRSWTGGLENVLLAHTAEEALDKAIQLLRKLDEKIPKTLAFRNSTENAQKQVKSKM